jgi:endonuclease III
MFYEHAMQMAFNFGAVEDLTWVRDQLRARLDRPAPIHARTPIGQLIKSSISSRTRDEVSLEAYHRLIEAYRTWSDLAEAPAEDIEAAIGEVTFADIKARDLRIALRTVASTHPDFDLTFLGGLGVPAALAWLERLRGVGRKVAASTLNFSTLRMPAFVVDTHVLRILHRFGFVRRTADIRAAYETIMAMRCDWNAAELAELHVLLKRLGQIICRADHACCDECPIRQRCKSAFASRYLPAAAAA